MDKNCGAFWKKIVALFLALLGKIVALLNFKLLSTLNFELTKIKNKMKDFQIEIHYSVAEKCFSIRLQRNGLKI